MQLVPGLITQSETTAVLDSSHIKLVKREDKVGSMQLVGKWKDTYLTVLIKLYLKVGKVME